MGGKLHTGIARFAPPLFLPLGYLLSLPSLAVTTLLFQGQLFSSFPLRSLLRHFEVTGWRAIFHQILPSWIASQYQYPYSRLPLGICAKTSADVWTSLRQPFSTSGGFGKDC